MAIKSSFASLKKSGNVESLLKNIEKSSSKSYVDDRQWKPTVDTSGNGFAIIRFLPISDSDIQLVEDADDALPYVKYYTHAFKNLINGKWFIENCPTSIGGECPVCERNTKLWNSGIESNKDIVSKHRKRQTKFVANIYVIQDPKNPEAEGKTFLFTFGPKILDKIKACSVKEFPDSVPFNPFDLWKGANFRLKIKNDKYGQRNYDASSFDKPEPLSTDDSLLEKIWESEYGLNESFLGKSQFKTYNELEKRLNDVLVETETSEQSPDRKSVV